MQKIISLFVRDYEGTRRVLNDVVPGAEWVLAGEGVATRKFDGTCCMVRDGRLYKRYDAKHGKAPPPGFEPAQPEADPVSGHWPGWLPVNDGPEDRYHREAWEAAGKDLPDGTYELVGPKINGGKEKAVLNHTLLRHGCSRDPDCPRDFDGIRAYLEEHDWMEGIVWHHPDGRMVKIKRRDLGLPWG